MARTFYLTTYMMNLKNSNLITKVLLPLVVVFFSFYPKNIEITNERKINTTKNVALDTLKLTPNESFFSPVGTLKAHLIDKTTGNEYNKYENYDYIDNWKVLSDTILFRVKLKKSGTLKIRPEMRIPSFQNGSIIYISVGNIRKELVLSSTASENSFEIQKGVDFDNMEAGVYYIKLQLKSIINSRESIGKLRGLQLIGTSVKDVEIEMRRYRPFAVHCKWGTDSPNPVEISVHELTVVNTSINCYQPITTPFGYTGSPWSLETKSFGGYNFSLWSYGANDPVPPFHQESHLIAVGPGLEFGSYGHEGTGVKPRGNNPYMGVKINKQVIAVRKSPGEKYDTYWSYYLDPVEGHWKLYGCGKKYNPKGTIEYLETGAFVEVSGPATTERSGHEIRETQYSGWQIDTSGVWHPINKMIGTSGENNLSFREWRIVGDKFSMRMGGWGNLDNQKETLILRNPKPIPEYLKGDFLQELYAMPTTFEVQTPIEITSHSASLSFNVADLGTNASAEVFWGTVEGLTKEEKWENKKKINISPNKNIVILSGLTPNTRYFTRIKITNDQGITWSYDTQIFKTI